MQLPLTSAGYVIYQYSSYTKKLSVLEVPRT